MAASVMAYVFTGFFSRSATRPARKDHSPRPPMNAVRPVETASVVDPKTRVRSRVHNISSTNPDAPDKKKQAKITDRMGLATVTSRPETPPPRLGLRFFRPLLILPAPAQATRKRESPIKEPTPTMLAAADQNSGIGSLTIGSERGADDEAALVDAVRCFVSGCRVALFLRFLRR